MRQSNVNGKCPYVCGPLTELDTAVQPGVKRFYARIADSCEVVLGVRAFVPHEHYDPVRHAGFKPSEVDAAERRQVCELTSLLIVVPIAPSWGGGIEVEMAYRSGVPSLLLCERAKLEARRISRLLRGNPSVISTVTYDTTDEALESLRLNLRTIGILPVPAS